jgi:hypothetical protein
MGFGAVQREMDNPARFENLNSADGEWVLLRSE